MNGATEVRLQDRLAREVKQSPLKAGLLGLGLAVALWVWVPRVIGGAPNSAVVELESALPDATGTTPEAGVTPALGRDSLAIRSEFIAISEETLLVRRFADPWTGTPSPRDPFAGVEPPPEAMPVVAAPASEEIAIDHDAERATAALAESTAAAGLSLSGILVFGSDARAVLDGRLVRKGDSIAGFEVIAIESRSVVLRGEHGEYGVAMKPPVAGEPEDGDDEAPESETDAAKRSPTQEENRP